MRRQLDFARIKKSLTSDWSLNSEDIIERRILYGNNEVFHLVVNRWYELARDTIKDPMIWFLIITSALFAILGNYNQAIILLLATIPIIGMDTFLHWRTQASTRSLRSRLASHAIVIRDGHEQTVATWELVPGDLVIVYPNHFFPADGLILTGKNLQVDESALTGESFPVNKEIITQVQKKIDTPLVDNIHWGLAGTRLLTGKAYVRIVYTGKETLYGEIVSLAQRTIQSRTPLQSAISKLIYWLIFIASFICLGLALARYYQGFGIIDSVLSATTLAVAALPDEFPVVFTFFLGVGVYRLAQKKALVRRAVSVENIGRITYICSDKTGTITEGNFKLVQCESPPDITEQDLLLIARAASRLESGDLLDNAIIKKSNELSLTIPQIITTFPFTEERKRETAISSLTHGKHLVATKGAPEVIMSISNLSFEDNKRWLESIKKFATLGYKVIACARCFTNDPVVEPKNKYQFLGLIAFEDPPRSGVLAAVNSCYQSQIHVLMITGDHPITAKAIATQIGLGHGHPAVISTESMAQDLNHMQAADFRSIDVIARAVPAQKLAIVRALQKSGEVVAVTGDGVNDVPALKAADIGIAMGEKGTQSAREVASIVLLDDNFSSIVNAIAEGRQLFKNLQLSFQYLLMIHIPFVISAALIPLLGYPLLYYPIHIVWIELIIHPTAMLVFQELPSSQKLEQVKRESKIKFFSWRNRLGIISTGFYTTLLVVISYILTIQSGGAVEYARGLAFSILGFSSVAFTIGLTNLRTTISRIVTIAVIVSTVLFIQIPIISQLFNIKSPLLRDWIIIILCSLPTLGLTKISK